MRSLLFVATVSAAIFAILCATGCGGSMFSNRIADYRAAATSLNAVVDAHAKSPAAADPATCSAAMADYARQAGAWVDRMQSMSGGLDQCMSSLGRSDRADLAAGCAEIRSELDTHARNGCASAGLAAEMTRHAAAMRDHTGHELDRMGEMEGMGSGMGMSGMQGCR